MGASREVGAACMVSPSPGAEGADPVVSPPVQASAVISATFAQGMSGWSSLPPVSLGPGGAGLMPLVHMSFATPTWRAHD